MKGMKGIAAVTLVAALLAGACSDEVVKPKLAVEPGQVSLAQAEREAAFQVQNTGGQSLHWSVACDCEWLSVTPSEGVDDGVITVRVDRTEMEPGTHNASVKVMSDGGDAVVPVTVEVTGRFEVQPKRIDFGNDRAPRDLHVTNPGAGTARWIATVDVDWITISSDSGTTDAVIKVTPVAANIDGDVEQEGTILIQDPDGNLEPETVAVTVTPPGEILVAWTADDPKPTYVQIDVQPGNQRKTVSYGASPTSFRGLVPGTYTVTVIGKTGSQTHDGGRKTVTVAAGRTTDAGVFRLAYLIPGTPTGVTASRDSESAIVVKWNPADSKHNGFDVYKNGSLYRHFAASAKEFTDGAVSVAEVYTYAVRATSSYGNSGSASASGFRKGFRLMSASVVFRGCDSRPCGFTGTGCDWVGLHFRIRGYGYANASRKVALLLVYRQSDGTYWVPYLDGGWLDRHAVSQNISSSGDTAEWDMTLYVPATSAAVYLKPTNLVLKVYRSTSVTNINADTHLSYWSEGLCQCLIPPGGHLVPCSSSKDDVDPASEPVDRPQAAPDLDPFSGAGDVRLLP